MTIPDTWDLAPERWFTALCEKPPAGGRVWVNPPASAATPVARSSWSVSIWGSDVGGYFTIGNTPQLTPELLSPPVQVLPRVGVDGLIEAAVILLVGVLVRVQSEQPHCDVAVLRQLGDGRPGRPAADHQIGLRAAIH